MRLLPGMLGPDAAPIDLEFDGPDAAHHDDAVIILVSNNPYQLVQLAGVGTPEAQGWSWDVLLAILSRDRTGH